jgi:DNA-binding CsgD family transcriptional regulator
LQQSLVPMVLVDAESRRYVDANWPARLAFRLSLDELRHCSVDDLTPPEHYEAMEETWEELLDMGSVSRARPVAQPGGSPLEIVVCAVANVLPGLHAGAFVPANWPEGELDALEDRSRDALIALTLREVEVLSLAARGLTSPEIATELVISATTVKTHFANIREKLGVPNRTAAVAQAIKLGLID